MRPYTRTALVTLAVMTLCLMFLASTMSYAQAPVRPNRFLAPLLVLSLGI